jgi:hypothetical protein
MHRDQGRGTNLEARRLSTLGRLLLGLLLLGLLGRSRRKALLIRNFGRLGRIGLIGRHVENLALMLKIWWESCSLKSGLASMAGHKGALNTKVGLNLSH